MLVIIPGTDGSSLMLTIMGPSTHGFCDRVSRRNLLRIGALGVSGTWFPGPLEASRSTDDRSLIMVYLPGGLTQSDTWMADTRFGRFTTAGACLSRASSLCGCRPGHDQDRLPESRPTRWACQ